MMIMPGAWGAPVWARVGPLCATELRAFMETPEGQQAKQEVEARRVSFIVMATAPTLRSTRAVARWTVSCTSCKETAMPLLRLEPAGCRFLTGAFQFAGHASTARSFGHNSCFMTACGESLGVGAAS